MKKKTKKILISFIVSIISIGILSVSVYATKEYTLRKSVAEFYEDKSVNDIVNLIKNADSIDELNLDDCLALGEKLSSASGKLVTSLISENNKFPIFQVLLFEIAEEYELEIKNSTVRKILCDNEASIDVRLNALYYASSVGENYIDDIKSLTTDSELGFAAMRELYSLDKKTALSLADSILASNPQMFTNEVSSALYVKSRKLQDGATKTELEEYIVQCDKILANTEDEEKKDIIYNYIASIYEFETLSYLINNERVSDINKYCYIGYAEEFIRKMLSETATPEKTEFLMKALKYGCHPEFYDSLITYIDNNKDFFEKNPELKSLANEARVTIENEIAERNGGK